MKDVYLRDRSSADSREVIEKRLLTERRKQPGVAFPSATKQEHMLIIRLNLEPSVRNDVQRVRVGLGRLCNLFDRIDKGILKIDELTEDGTIEPQPLANFNFTATIGFGAGFFEKLQIKTERRPRNLYEMPNHVGLLDPVQYRLLQTDFIIQLCSSKDFVNRWIFESDAYQVDFHEENHLSLNYTYARGRTNPNYKEVVHNMESHDISTAVSDWAIVTDVHAGFQRVDGRNLMGFNDGISNVDRLKNDVIWTNKQDENERLREGTYMVFSKIEHDLERWRQLGIREQERWVGRSKGTGLLLGTLSKEADDKLASDCKSEVASVRKSAQAKLKKLISEQNDPEENIFDTGSHFENIRLECPVWSHVRKVNPRGEGGIEGKKIFRRGYLFMENSSDGKVSSGLLFICFQRNIKTGFEYIKKKFMNNKDFPVPEKRTFTRAELSARHRSARFSKDELQKLGSTEKSLLGFDTTSYKDAIREAEDEDSQNTGREGLSGPSKLGVRPGGEFLATVTLGGGYYFVPPIPHKNLTRIAEQFFDD